MSAARKIPIEDFDCGSGFGKPLQTEAQHKHHPRVNFNPIRIIISGLFESLECCFQVIPHTLQRGADGLDFSVSDNIKQYRTGKIDHDGIGIGIGKCLFCTRYSQIHSPFLSEEVENDWPYGIVIDLCPFIEFQSDFRHFEHLVLPGLDECNVARRSTSSAISQ